MNLKKTLCHTWNIEIVFNFYNFFSVELFRPWHLSQTCSPQILILAWNHRLGDCTTYCERWLFWCGRHFLVCILQKVWCAARDRQSRRFGAYMEDLVYTESWFETEQINRPLDNDDILDCSFPFQQIRKSRNSWNFFNKFSFVFFCVTLYFWKVTQLYYSHKYLMENVLQVFFLRGFRCSFTQRTKNCINYLTKIWNGTF